ncbi:MAG: hydrogenase maturation protein [Gammaproteobacteria bacterium]|jgi:putative two-component system hydrogenase maturation factor HypX/HoxX|nr:hydrogenase maturation protein [Gammaproteobacteria bacterium]MBT3725924.1 hydrogenase maturation protein [Gammaproteobacteria bacterium]MBT4077192.1 hydrogenase maturation protein [Gammaproteobacteria bacterium]MBT4195863.1 hydrogenase maturation protein [Gammaproteobacteria bacterium]MBT4448971.1 hydrogenase maturation protein [Gammaproteobacteria bacterium]
MRILLLCHAFNSLTQRLFVELEAQGHDISVEFDINDETSLQAVNLFQPELIIAPYLKRAIPESIWKKTICLIVHPGITGDRGPSSLDWAILKNLNEWGVTVLQANAEMDAGDIWSTVSFPMRKASKANLYRNEVTEAALQAVNIAIQKYQQADFSPLSLRQIETSGDWQPLMQQSDRQINWNVDDSATIIKKIKSADGFPGIKQKWFDRELYLFDVHHEPELHGKAGEFIGQNETAICIATTDSAVWIGHLKDKQSSHPFKLPATIVLKDDIRDLPFIDTKQSIAYQPVRYHSANGVGYLHFNFYNGAMSTTQCQQLREALVQAKQQPTKIIVLMGGDDFWSNGMHLNQIEAATSAADESWDNINAINDLSLEIINTESQLIFSAMRGNAGAGGVFLARAADEVWARQGIILNPHYKDMGNLYGSEYWSYLLPRFAGEENSQRISQSRLPMGLAEAKALGLVDKIIDSPRNLFYEAVRQRCEKLLNSASDNLDINQQLEKKQQQRTSDEAIKPLSAYRELELNKMKKNFYGFDPSYHIARYNFVYKIAKSRTPLTIAKHRRISDIVRRVS